MSRRKIFTQWFGSAIGFVILFLTTPTVSAQPSSPPATPMRSLEGRHITLVTDLPSEPNIDRLPQIFDQAIDPWARYFQVKAADYADWRITGYLMRNDQRFRDAGLLPDDLPPFLHGYQRGDVVWLREQPSDYYQRHLLLHEGTHAFMVSALGGSGAAWYMEGVAEYLATHRWQDGKLQLAIFPNNRQEVSHWGRIKIIRDSVAAGRSLRLEDVFRIDGADFRHVDAYAWTWAAITFLESDPRFSEPFLDLQQKVNLPSNEFSAAFWSLLAEDPTRLRDAWEGFLAEVDYGNPPQPQSIDYQPLEDLATKQRRTVASDRGWQSTGIRLAAGKRYLVRARGRYQVVTGAEQWWSEAGGVTIEYHRGHPKGMLMAALVDRSSDSISFAQPIPVGDRYVIQPEKDAELFLRINEPFAELKDNRGSLLVQIEEAIPPPN